MYLQKKNAKREEKMRRMCLCTVYTVEAWTAESSFHRV